MTVRINGTALTAQPTSVTWNQNEPKFRNGLGAGIYAAFKTVELRWDYIGVSDFQQLYNFALSNGTTGTSAVTLPKYNTPTYVDYAYSGCIVNFPTAGELFEQHYSGVTMVITKVRT